MTELQGVFILFVVYVVFLSSGFLMAKYEKNQNKKKDQERKPLITNRYLED